MDKTEIQNLIESIGTSEDDAERREGLATLSEEIASLFDSHAELTKTNETLAAENESVKEANMKLFLRVQEQRKGDNGYGTPEPPKEKRKFEDLLDSKGGFKK